MRIIKTITPAILVAILAVGLMPQPASAETATSNIAVVNIQEIMRDSTAAKSVREQLEAKQKTYQTEISKKEEAMQKEEQELMKQRSVLSKEAFEEKATAFRTKATDMQKDVAAKKATLDMAFERALNDIQKVVTDIITDMAKEKSFQVALPSSQLLYAEPGMDISAEVLKRLNSKLPKVSVKFEKPKDK